MNEIVVYLTPDYSVSDTFLCPINWTKEEIKEEVDRLYDSWCFFDILKK